MTQGSEESVEQWGDRVMEAAQCALGARVSGSVLQEQKKMRFAMGYNEPSAGRQLLERTLCTMDEAVRRVKTYQLSVMPCHDVAECGWSSCPTWISLVPFLRSRENKGNRCLLEVTVINREGSCRTR